MKPIVIAHSKVKSKTLVLLALCVSAAIALNAQPATTFTILHSFCPKKACTDGEFPEGELVQATNGNLYGVTANGGTDGHIGTVFEITPSGTLTTQYAFCSQTACADGQTPFSTLVQATNGDLYGTTTGGGGGVEGFYNGAGTVFKITEGRTLTRLYIFCTQSGCPDGGFPYAGLVRANNGDLYGTTAGGGTYSNGTIFKITPSGTLTTLYSFSGGADGGDPRAAMVLASNGDLYGTTYQGGANGDYGTIFKITPGGSFTTLHSFCSQSACADGEFPVTSLVQASDGDLYGTTLGRTSNHGTIFKISPSGTLTTLYSFCSQTNCTDGSSPYAKLMQATDGNLYGTTMLGGAHSLGTIFQITPSGTLTTLHSFCAQTNNCLDGSYPQAGLVQATNGDLYGTTSEGGAHTFGTVFKLSVGLGPFIELEPTSGKVGATVKILGTDLAGTTSVSFNGVAAEFEVVSATKITATVPTGATSGTVQVITPGATLEGNIPFKVNE